MRTALIAVIASEYYAPTVPGGTACTTVCPGVQRCVDQISYSGDRDRAVITRAGVA
ncbi:MAG: hypothetical protein WKG01_40480 [Kofleriaceae bacterium]